MSILCIFLLLWIFLSKMSIFLRPKAPDGDNVTGADTGVCKRTFSHLYFVDYGKKSQFYDHYQGAPLNNKEKRPHLEFIPVLTPEQCFVIRAGLEVSINAFYTVDKVIIHAFTN